MSESELWRFLPLGYALTVLIEAPILFFGLSRRHSAKTRLVAGLWLTACTYPIVVLVLPPLMQSSPRWQYLTVAETFAPAAECVLFWLAYGRAGSASKAETIRDAGAIVAANVVSFVVGLLLF